MTAPGTWRVLVVAKAPVPGRVKTRLGADVGMDRAAALASASLLDTLEAAVAAVGARRCHLSLEGDLAGAVGATALLAATAGWTVTPQRGGHLGERLAGAHADVAASGPGAVVQVGMDTPQVTAGLLADVAAGLDGATGPDIAGPDAVLGPAEDGGWWVLGLRDPLRAAVLGGVPMSTPTTCTDTRAALEASGLVLGTGPVLRDVDTVADADAVARTAPSSRFARTWDGARSEVRDHAPTAVGGRTP